MSFQTYKSSYLWFTLLHIIITVNDNSKDNVLYIYMCVCVCTFEEMIESDEFQLTWFVMSH